MTTRVWQMWLGLVFSMICTVLFGMDLAYNVYAVALKQTFNFTQTEVELIAVSGAAGMGASLIEPFLTSRFGYKVGYTVIWLTTSGSVLLLGLAVVFRDLSKHWVTLISLIHFFFNAGDNAGNARLATTSMGLLSERHTGKLVGVSLAAAAAGKLVYGGLFQLFSSDNLQGFFFTIAASKAVCFGVCFAIHRPDEETNITKAEAYKEQSSCVDTISSHDEKIPINPDKIPCSREKNPVASMVKSLFFHLTFWPSAVMYGILFTYMNNITSIAYSMGIHQPLNTVYLLSATTVIGRFSFGLLFDKFQSNVCGFILLLTGSLSTVVGVLLLVLKLTDVIVYLVACLLGVGMSVGLTIPASLLAMRFGQKNLAYILGCLYLFTSCFCLIFQFIFGMLYDRSISSDGFCYGSLCFFSSSIILLTVMALSTIVYIVGCITHLRNG